MKKFFSLLFFIGIVCARSFAQNTEFCGTTESYMDILNSDPKIRALREASDKEVSEIDRILFNQGYNTTRLSDNTKANSIIKAQGVVYTIPVVFHVLHLGGGENISEAQIRSCVDNMNMDFSGTTPDTANTNVPFKGLEANAEIRFQLATIDPNGNCTNGITRHYDANTDWVKGTTPFDYTWNRTKYYNIYVVRTLTSSSQANLAGYSSFPGTNGASADVTVILNSYVGSIGTATPGRAHTMTHETGHFLNLYHTWDCCTSVETACGTDGVSDTPQTKGHSNTCPTGVANQICVPGVEENPNNYMDYSYCYTMFTAGQATRMRNTVINNVGNVGRSNLVSAANLLATGVTNPQICVPLADFDLNKNYVCSGNSVTFSDNSENAHPTSWSWDFPGGTPATSTDSTPVIVYNTPGVYPVTYTATTVTGSDVITKNSLVNVSSSTAGVQAPLIESYESITVPNTDWAIDNTSGGPGWEQTTTTACTGASSMMINNYSNTGASVEVLYTPSYNLSAMNAASPGLVFTFKLSHQRKTTTASEKLQVFSSTNCGYTWTQRYSKSGSALANVTGANTNPFVPSSASQWRTESVAISALAAQTNVWFKFVFTSDAGGETNNVYIDDINITNNGVGLQEAFESQLNYTVFPNPAYGNVHVAFDLAGKHTVKLELVDVLGKTLEIAVSEDLYVGSYNYSFGSVTKPAPGIYFSKLTIDGKSIIRKIIIE